ncbi:hypothetical protein GCM10010404_64540 [Nonomuraea africana]|uniref:Uncharacterized protein n=1 Tax=Nonomuraea africana TaxID=46171 RepID=A0ABR9KGX8_9ACTN|nr:DUF6220 domain-containing protein [Nonomuraea africana]MBE1561273.1 hypothetical protein [Nonomuraea africana]
MRKVLVVFTVIQLALVVLQFYLATYGAFETPEPADPESAAIGWHVLNGFMVIPAVSLVTTILAAVARAPGKLIGLCAAPIVLVAIQMFVLFPLAELAGATMEKTTPASLYVLGFHAIVGVLLLGAAISAVRGAQAHARSGAGRQATETV